MIEINWTTNTKSNRVHVENLNQGISVFKLFPNSDELYLFIGYCEKNSKWIGFNLKYNSTMIRPKAQQVHLIGNLESMNITRLNHLDEVLRIGTEGE